MNYRIDFKKVTKKIFLLFFLLSLSFCLTKPVYAERFDETVIEGWSLEKIVKGKKDYSIQAEKASFGSKKIGFFNIALVKVINLDDVCLTLYDNGVIIKTQYLTKAVYKINTKRLFDENGNLVFSENSLNKS